MTSSHDGEPVDANVIGYSVPPFGVAELEQGKTRIVGRGVDLPALARQTVRFIVVNADALAKRPDAFRRYMQGYREMVDWMFSADPQALAAYAKWAGVPERVARRTPMISSASGTRCRTRFPASTPSWPTPWPTNSFPPRSAASGSRR